VSFNTSQQTTTDNAASISQTNQVKGYYESQDGRHFIEFWLIDPTWNLNSWKVAKDELESKIQNFVGKPLILTPYFHHPHEYEHVKENPFDPTGNVRLYNTIDERYRVGNILKIKPLQNAAYAAVGELTHPAMVKAAKEGKIPLYVSPACYNLDMTGMFTEYKHFEPLHVAFVLDPAHGPKAKVLNTCQGQEDICLRNLGVAADIMGPSCIAKALEKLDDSNTFHSSYTKSNANVASELSVKEDSATPPTATSVSPTDSNNNTRQVTVSTEETKESKAPVKQGKPEAPKKEQTKESTADTKKDTNAESKKKDEESAEPKFTLDDVKKVVAEALKSYDEEKEKKAALAKKRELIESYVTLESTAGSAEEREKRIAALMHIPDEDLKNFLEQHYQIKGKARNNAGKASTVRDFNRGMQQNDTSMQQNAGTAAVIALEQEANEKVDRVLSMTRFVPNSAARIVPNMRARAEES
jgi:hypothetical protein